MLRADSLLDLLQNYLHLEEKTDEATGKVSTSLIFPRYHQMDCVRALLAEARAHGPGENYLIQHSAGSGKSNTIAWLAHQLANLFTDAEGENSQLVFDSVIIITDRQVLDKQLQDTVKQFEKAAGLVQKIDRNTRQLVEALASGAKIIVCTLQKFSWMRTALGGPKGLKGKKFALIVDEAHSSQSGEGAKDLKLVLTTPEALQQIIAEDDENAEWDDPVAEELALIMKGRQRLPHLSFFAFTATPKTKTLEVFGKPREVVTVEGVKKVEHKAFHSYTMRQAIEEGFILDVVENYTTYGTYFELLENEKAPPGYEVETAKGRRLLMQHVGRHPHTIESKAKIMLDHFFTKTAHKIGGEAKAMVVTSSRAHARRNPRHGGYGQVPPGGKAERQHRAESKRYRNGELVRGWPWPRPWWRERQARSDRKRTEREIPFRLRGSRQGVEHRDSETGQGCRADRGVPDQQSGNAAQAEICGQSGECLHL